MRESHRLAMVSSGRSSWREFNVLIVRNIMSPIKATIARSAPVGEAIRKMVEYGVGYLPVVDDQGQLVGWLTEGDLIRLLHRAGHPEEFDMPSRWLTGATALTLRALPVADALTPEAEGVAPDTPVQDVADLIFRNRRKVIPVVEGGRVLGAVHRMSVIQALL